MLLYPALYSYCSVVKDRVELPNTIDEPVTLAKFKIVPSWVLDIIANIIISVGSREPLPIHLMWLVLPIIQVAICLEQ